MVACRILKKSSETTQCPVNVTLRLLWLQAGGRLHATFTAFNPFLLRALSSGLELPFDKKGFKDRGKRSSASCK